MSRAINSKWKGVQHTQKGIAEVNGFYSKD